MSTFIRLTHNALQDAQAATVYAILYLKVTLEEVLTELRDITSKD